MYYLHWNGFPEEEKKFLLTSYDDLSSNTSISFAEEIKNIMGQRVPKINYLHDGEKYFGVVLNKIDNRVVVCTCDGMDDSSEFFKPLEVYPNVS